MLREGTEPSSDIRSLSTSQEGAPLRSPGHSGRRSLAPAAHRLTLPPFRMAEPRERMLRCSLSRSRCSLKASAGSSQPGLPPCCLCLWVAPHPPLYQGQVPGEWDFLAPLLPGCPAPHRPLFLVMLLSWDRAPAPAAPSSQNPFLLTHPNRRRKQPCVSFGSHDVIPRDVISEAVLASRPGLFSLQMPLESQEDSVYLFLTFYFVLGCSR